MSIRLGLSQEWKSDEVLEVRTVRPINEQPSGLFTQHTDIFIVENDNMDSDTEAELEMSLKSRSFLHRVNDQVRKRQNQSSKDAPKRQRQTLCDMGMFMSFYITSICIHGEGLIRQFTFHQKYRRSHNETDVRHI